MQKLPEKFIEEMKELLGEEGCRTYLASFEDARSNGLRVNTLKISPEEFVKISPFPLTPIPWTHNGFWYPEDCRPARHPYYYAGLYYLQEPSAMVPAQILPIDPGDKVLDICAAPGGKSTELAAKLNGTGILVSNDISSSRAQALLKNLELFGVSNAVITTEDPEKLSSRFFQYFDKILIDAPCSGEGMFRKDPAVIRSWEEHGHEFYIRLQKKIAAAVLPMLKPGGMMVYSTCTFYPGEDEDIILYMKELCPELEVMKISDRFEGFSEGMPEKAAYDDPSLKNCLRLFPHKIKGEGHFAALLKKGGEKAGAVISEVRKKAKLAPETEDFLNRLTMDFSEGTFTLRGSRVFFERYEQPDTAGIRTLRSGPYLGEEKKKRFEPSQALSMALKETEFPLTISLEASDIRVIRYLKGETVDVSDITTESGWVLVCTDHYPLGFAKASRGILKNHYLPGWRYLS